MTDFKQSFHGELFRFARREWVALGLPAGNADTARPSRPVDPEALFFFTCYLGRQNRELFDDLLAWLDVNGTVINVQRLRKIMSQEKYLGFQTISCIAELLSQRHRFLKWKGLVRDAAPFADGQPFFVNEPAPAGTGSADPLFLKHGFLREPFTFPERGTMPIPTAGAAGLLYRLRALFGINARSEILLYLLTHVSVHPSRIARETYFSQKTVQDTLVEMARSGMVRMKKEGKSKHYWIDRERWFAFLEYDGGVPGWVNWPQVFKSIKLTAGVMARTAWNPSGGDVRGLLRDIRPLLDNAGFGAALSDDTRYAGADAAGTLVHDMMRLVKTL